MENDEVQGAPMTKRETDSPEPSPDELLDTLEPFEPYTTDELTETFTIERSIIRRLLDKLTEEQKIRKKKPPSSPTIWIREPPVNRCNNCGREFEVKFIHSVLSSVQFCPRCGNQL